MWPLGTWIGVVLVLLQVGLGDPKGLLQLFRDSVAFGLSGMCGGDNNTVTGPPLPCTKASGHRVPAHPIVH